MHQGKALLCGALLAVISGCASWLPPAPSAATTAEAPAEVAVPVRTLPDDSVYDLLLAEFAIRRQHFDLALERYLHQAEQTRDIGVVSTAARLAQYMNNQQATLEAVALWLQLSPNDVDAHYLAASALAKIRQPLRALPHMITVLDHGGETNFAALAASALTLTDAEQQRFLDELDKLLERHPGELSLKTAKALLLQYRNEEEAALALIRDVLDSDDSNIHALLIETRLLQQLERHDEAVERLRFAVDAYPNHKRLRLQLAQQLMRDDLHQAKAHYTVLTRQHPDDGNLLLGLALINRELGDSDAARQQLDSLKRLATHQSTAHYFLGQLAEQEQSWDSATEHYLQVAPGEEFSAAVKRLTAIADREQGLPTARRHLRELRQRFPPQDVQLTLIESDLLFEHRAYDEGHRLLSDALLRHPREINLLYARSLFSERRQNIDLLEADLRTILSDDPDNATALNALGYSLAILTDRLEEARILVQRALDIRPQDPSIQDSYGWIAYRQGDLELAHTYLERAFKQSQDHEIAAHLGEVLWQLGRQQRAMEVWADGLRDQPDSPLIRETMRRLKAEPQ